MQDRARASRVTHTVIAVAAAFMAAAGQSPAPALANDAVALDTVDSADAIIAALSMGPPAPPPADDEPETAAPPAQAEDHDEHLDAEDAPGDAGAVEVAEAPPAVAATEAMPLGAPNRLLSARPVDDTVDPGLTGGLASLDPRTNQVTRVVGALGMVLALLVGLRWSTRRIVRRTFLGAGRPSGVVEILARYPLARSQHLLLVKVSRRVLVLHENGTTLRMLSEFTNADEVAALLGRIEAGSEGRSASRFQAMLKDFRAEHDATASVMQEPGGSENEFIDLTRPRAGARGRRGWRATA